MNLTRYKSFVVNAPRIDGTNVVVDAGAATNAPDGMIVVNDTAGKFLFAFQKKNAEFQIIPAASEVRQVVEITFPTIIAYTKYTIIREQSPLALVGRDASQYVNTKKYSYTSPAVLGAGATEKTNAINTLVAKINADDSNFATAANKSAGGLILQITEDAGYGLLPSYPGPASWMCTNCAVGTYALTPGKVALGNGTVMLARQAIWNIDKTWLRSGKLEYNFDATLPTSGKTYTTLIITEKYNVKDHFNSDPNIVSDILVYIDNDDAHNVNNFLWMIGVPGYTQYTPQG
jgi:hypothetical protein